MRLFLFISIVMAAAGFFSGQTHCYAGEAKKKEIKKIIDLLQMDQYLLQSLQSQYVKNQGMSKLFAQIYIHSLKLSNFKKHLTKKLEQHYSLSDLKQISTLLKKPFMQKMISLELKTKNAWDNAPSVNTQMLSLTKENSHRKKSKALTQILPMYKMYLSLANYFEPYDLSQQQYFKHLRTQGSSKEKLTERYHDSLQKLSEEQQARENEFVEKITDYYVNNSYESEVREFIRITKKTKLKSFLQRSVVEFDRFTRSHAKANFTRILKSITKNQTASI